MEHLSQLFVEAGTLLLAGMAFVFAFLGMLVIFINTVLNRLSVKYPDAVSKTNPQRVASSKQNASKSISPNVVAAISSAVKSYRQQNKSK